jgi:adenylate kinase
VISSGELLRAAAAADRDVWHDIAAPMARGELLPDDVVLAVINDALKRVGSDGYILEGFPRTRAQAEHVDAPSVDAVIHLAVPDAVARERIARRAGIGRTDDTNLATVERRLRDYHSETEPLLDLYRRRGVLRSVEASQKPEAVTADILQALDNDRG